MFKRVWCAIFGHKYRINRKMFLYLHNEEKIVSICECLHCRNESLRDESGVFPVFFWDGLHHAKKYMK